MTIHAWHFVGGTLRDDTPLLIQRLVLARPWVEDPAVTLRWRWHLLARQDWRANRIARLR